MMKRLFIGVPVESEIAVNEARKWQNDRLLNQNQMSWTKPENWHVTLFFLGDTPETEIDLLQQLIDKSFHAVKGFIAKLNGVGVFPNQRNPKVLWLGLESLQPLMSAYEQLGDLLRHKVFSFDAKPMKPHLTLGRIKSLENNASFESLLTQYQRFNFGHVVINRVVLFESSITPNGPIYKQLFVKWLK